MTIQFTPEGVVGDNLATIISRLSAEYKAIYGQDINVDQDSPDGQRIGIEAKARADMQAFCLEVYNSMDPDLARSVGLDRISKIAGITRRPATRSTWDITVTTSRPLTLDEGYEITDDLGQGWFVPSAVTLATGSTVVTFRAVDFGAVSNSAGATFTQATVVLGVTGFNAAVAPVVGADEESDGQYRIRRNKSVQNPSYSTVGGLYARLANTPGVLDAQVYENDTDTYDAVRDMAPHSIWAVVEGGTVEDIAETIALNKTAGTAQKGAQTQVYNETRIRPNGSTFVVPHTVLFDRPVIVNLYINVTATRKNAAEPIDQALIKLLLEQVVFAIGEEAVASELYDPAYVENPNYFLTDLQISDDDSTYTDERLTSAINGKFVIVAANITVTEVTP